MAGDGAAAYAKADLRRRMRRLRAALDPAQRAAASRAIAAHLSGLPELAGARHVLAYAATPAEVDLDAWFRGLLAAGRDVSFPVVAGADLHAARVVDPDRDLGPGWRGLREPPASAPRTDPALIDLAVVPGLAFDRRGGRLGQGGGHLDRLLARLRPAATVVGVAFDVQRLPPGTLLPAEDHDVGMAMVVTETGVWRPA